MDPQWERHWCTIMFGNNNSNVGLGRRSLFLRRFSRPIRTVRQYVFERHMGSHTD